MSTKVHCDGCGDTAEDHFTVDWYKLTLRDEEFDFCTVACIGDWHVCREKRTLAENAAARLKRA